MKRVGGERNRRKRAGAPFPEEHFKHNHSLSHASQHASHLVDHEAAEHAIRLLVTEDLDHALCIVVGLCARVCRHWERAHRVLDALLLELLLCLAHPRNLRVGVDDRRHAVVVNVRVATEHALHADDALVLGLAERTGDTP